LRLVARVFVLLLLLATGVVVGCAALGEGNGTGGTGGEAGPGLSLACTNSETDEISLVDWELTVSPNPDPIESGRPFTATLDGAAVFEESYMDAGHEALPEGLLEINMVDFNATVQVRSGATGPDVILEPDIPYECDHDRKACSPDNDLPSVPGLVGNADCEPVSAANPCGRFLLAPLSKDCVPDGVCASRGKTGPGSQCELHGSCITGGVRIELQETTGQYTADAQGTVLFGWDDQSTGATIEEEGPNKGTWVLPEADYYEPTGPTAFRVTSVGYPVAAECTMGVDCMDPDSGVDCLDSLPSPTPNAALISFRIRAEAF